MWTLCFAMLPPEFSENVEQVGLRLRRGLRARLSATLHPECLENVERVGLRVRRGLRALLPAMLPPECSENVERVELRALFLSSAPSERSEKFERAGL